MTEPTGVGRLPHLAPPKTKLKTTAHATTSTKTVDAMTKRSFNALSV